MDRKRKKGYYIKSAKQKKAKRISSLEAGMVGYLVTGNNEKQTVRDTYSLLNDYADRLFGPEKINESESEDEDDMEAAVRKCIEKHQQPTQRRFQSADTGVKGWIFVKTTLDTPEAVTDLIFSELQSTKTARSRHIMRLIPVAYSCKVDASKLSDQSLSIVETYVKDLTEFTYCLDIKIRHNPDITSRDIMDAYTQAVTDLKPLARVNLSAPDVVFSVNVFKRVLCVSVLRNFHKYRKYNLQQLTTVAEGDEDKKQLRGSSASPLKETDGAETNSEPTTADVDQNPAPTTAEAEQNPAPTTVEADQNSEPTIAEAEQNSEPTTAEAEQNSKTTTAWAEQTPAPTTAEAEQNFKTTTAGAEQNSKPTIAEAEQNS